MPLFGIVIPFRPLAESNNWIEESNLLNKTLHSVLNQTDPGFEVFVVYTELPEVQISDPRIHLIPFPYGYIPFDKVPNNQKLLNQFKSEKLVVRRWDKGRKISYGSLKAKEAGCTYIMNLDADDRVSKHLISYMRLHAKDGKTDGWFVHKGYLYGKDAGFLIRVPRHMNYVNGSTHILRSDLVTIPDFTSEDWIHFNLFTDHGWIRTRMKDEFKAGLQAIPFPAIVYLVHGSNISKVRNNEFGFRLRSFAKRILRGVILSKKLKDEFYLYQ
jgi:glycosyltransferase involved in cell wall biosynthesis